MFCCSVFCGISLNLNWGRRSGESYLEGAHDLVDKLANDTTSDPCVCGRCPWGCCTRFYMNIWCLTQKLTASFWCNRQPRLHPGHHPVLLMFRPPMTYVTYGRKALGILYTQQLKRQIQPAKHCSLHSHWCIVFRKCQITIHDARTSNTFLHSAKVFCEQQALLQLQLLLHRR